MLTTKRTHRRAAAVMAIVIAVIMAIAMPLQSAALLLGENGKYYSDFSSLEEVKAAADELNTELSAEGNVLLKNDGTLPLFGSERISVFGAAQDSMVGANGSMTVTAALSEVGFKVNPTLEKYYAGVGTTIGTETASFGKNVENSFALYNDAAVIILSRTGGEGNDLVTVTAEKEDNKDGNGESYDWTHQALFSDEKGVYKHYLQLTDSEEAMIAFVKANFKKIVVLVNTSNAMELGNLQDDDAINAILWIGRPGSTGIKAMAQILNGTVNPSGRLVDEWYRDFTADPTWYNFGNNTQVGSFNTYNKEDGTPTGANAGGGMAGATGYHGIDYEEDIYLGYRYYETVYAELVKDETIRYDAATKTLKAKAEVTTSGYNAKNAADAWWNFAVVYPFGYGLSYTTFQMDLGNVYYFLNGTKTELKASESGSLFASSVGSPAKVKKLYAPVTVTNTGSVAGKQVVEIYVTSPYTKGKVEKAAVDLVGFGKTSLLAPGQSETVTVEFNVQDFAAFDYADKNGNGYSGYELDVGSYQIKVMNDSHVVADTQEFTLSSEALLKLDDFSDNEVVTWFSGNDDYNTVRGEGTKFNKDDSAHMTLLSRADLVGTFPKAPEEKDLTLTDALIHEFEMMDAFDADNLADESAFPWYLTETELKALMAGWTQVEAYENNDYSSAVLKLRDMAGVDIKTEEGRAKWTQLMNQLTWAEIEGIVNHGSHTTYAVPSIDKTATKDENGPNSYCGKTWCDETVLSSTWNTELAEQYGIINANLGMFSGQQGWYGPGMNIHRSPFAGRNNEYYSQDGVQGGYIAAAQVGGAQSRGLNVYIKHMFINDQETHRNGECLFTWASEAAIRMTYVKCFQMAMQEGGATSAMTAFARLGRVPASANYNFLTGLVREEWGWEGQYVTDAWGGLKCVTMDIAIRTGNDLPDGTASGAKALSGTWSASEVGVGTSAKPSGNVIVGTEGNTKASLLQWYYARVCAERVLYVAANTQNNRNGVVTTAYANAATVNAKQGEALKDSGAAMSAQDANNGTVTYAVTAGTLPSGISLNGKTGELTGTPTVAGDTTVTVTANVDGWISASKKVTISIAPGFELTGNAGKVGEAFDEIIDSEVVVPSKYNKGITYAVSSGALPEGLVLSEDHITGTPVKAGTYQATIKIEGTNQTGSGRRVKTTVDTYFFDVILTIEGDGTVPAVDHGGVTGIVKASEGLVDTYTITYADGTTYEFSVTNGKDGENGVNGTNGTNGADGAKGEKGDTGAAGEKGADGAKGEKGDTGAAGEKGADGENASAVPGIIGMICGILALALVVVFVIIRKKK